MYTLDSKGNKVPYGNSKPFSKENFSFEPSNHTVLYVALAIAVIVAGAGGYFLYKHYKSDKESFGYSL